MVEGYGLMQPRITPSLPTNGEGSFFQRIFSGPSGIDPYASAVSDVYQDLFREGSYTGKGIYDLDAFEAALAGKVPDNTLLSHDLFEGIFARARLPPISSCSRNSRLTMRPPPPASTVGRAAIGSCCPGFSDGPRDRRTNANSSPSHRPLEDARQPPPDPFGARMFLTLLAGWLMPGISPWLWTRFALAMISIPALIPFLAGVNARLGGISKRSHFRGVASDLRWAYRRRV